MVSETLLASAPLGVASVERPQAGGHIRDWWESLLETIVVGAIVEEWRWNGTDMPIVFDRHEARRTEVVQQQGHVMTMAVV